MVQDNKLVHSIGKACTVLRQLNLSVILKKKLFSKAKLSVFKSVFVSILTYGFECCVTIDRVRSRIQATKMGFLQKVRGLSLLDQVPSTDVCQSHNIEPLLLRTERSQLPWYDHVTPFSHKQTAKQLLDALLSGKNPRERVRICWRNYAEDLAWSHIENPPA